MKNLCKIKRHEYRPIIGIVGGMGPDATIDFQIKLSKIMKEKLNILSDQDYYRVIIDNNTHIPDRTQAVLYKGQSPVPKILESIKLMENLNVDLIAIPCNTVHFYFKEIQDSTIKRIVNMIEETINFIVKRYKNIKKIGLLSTVAVIKSKIYQLPLADKGIELVVPDLELQSEIFKAIYGIKAGYYKECDLLNYKQKEKLAFVYKQHEIKTLLNNSVFIKPPSEIILSALKNLETKGVKHVILGCTEIPILINQGIYNGSCNLIDPTYVLASKVVDLAINFSKINYDVNKKELYEH